MGIAAVYRAVKYKVFGRSSWQRRTVSRGDAGPRRGMVDLSAAARSGSESKAD
jgi:hypothetical protein